MPKPTKPSRSDAQATVARLMATGCGIRRSLHAQTRQRERNFDDQDIQHVLRTGVVTTVQIHQRTRRPVFVIEGRDVEGVELKLVVETVESRNLIRIVTGM